MKKVSLLILLISANIAMADNLITKRYDPKPMIEGNRRVDELIEWEKNHPGEMPPLTEQEKYEFFIKQGIPVPGSGASVVNNNKGFTQSQMATVKKFNYDQKNKGYAEMINKRANTLLSMPEIAEKEYNQRKSFAFNPHDSHLYEVKSNLPISYDYKGVPSALVTKVIGYAPESIFIKSGWAGVVEFFIPSFDSVCAYHEVNIELTKSSAYFPKEIATYIINNKLTKINVIGSQDSGFVYEVEWWDKSRKRNLECASKTYTETMRNNTIELAKQIDKV